MKNARVAALVAIFLALPAHLPPASAAGTCATYAVSSHGEPAAFEWLAKTKARANWRSRVRGTKALGEAYSTWNRADNRDERCTTSARGITCTFTAIPCHR
jgi:hypothetical protein